MIIFLIINLEINQTLISNRSMYEVAVNCYALLKKAQLKVPGGSAVITKVNPVLPLADPS